MEIFRSKVDLRTKRNQRTQLENDKLMKKMTRVPKKFRFDKEQWMRKYAQKNEEREEGIEVSDGAS